MRKIPTLALVAAAAALLAASACDAPTPTELRRPDTVRLDDDPPDPPPPPDTTHKCTGMIGSGC